jgi:hypothetical protein
MTRTALWLQQWLMTLSRRGKSHKTTHVTTTDNTWWPKWRTKYDPDNPDDNGWLPWMMNVTTDWRPKQFSWQHLTTPSGNIYYQSRKLSILLALGSYVIGEGSLHKSVLNHLGTEFSDKNSGRWHVFNKPEFHDIKASTKFSINCVQDGYFNSNKTHLSVQKCLHVYPSSHFPGAYSSICMLVANQFWHMWHI